MWTRISYFSRETLVSLRRNVLMTVAGVATVAVSLALFGGILMLSKWVDHGTARIKGGVTLEIFMKVDASKQQIADIKTELDADKKPGGTVKSYRHLNKEDAYTEFKRIFRRNPDLVNSIRASDLPESFRVAPTKAELTDTVRDGARESHYHFVGPVAVSVVADPGAGVGDLHVDAAIVAGPDGPSGTLVLPDGHRIELGADPVTVGRLPDCAIPLSDTQVSRHHAEIRRADQGFEVVDLKSLNGTSVNGVKVQQHALADGDVISVGETAIRYEES